MEMQDRKLNWRESFKFHATQMNVSANYYPVDSAIAIRDEKNKDSDRFMQMTVMNDRSQGGSGALYGSNIELMQNRRGLTDDDKDLHEPLNETDADGYGMKVNARYWLDIVDLKTQNSDQ